MPRCAHCSDDRPTDQTDDGFTSCTGCGRVLSDHVFHTVPTFQKTTDGHTGVLIKSITKGRKTIQDIVTALEVSGGESIANEAHKYFTIAVHKENFTRRRIRTHVAAACLYVTLRRNDRPYLLINLADYLRVSVYVLGAVFVALCRILCLCHHPFIRRPVDPSLFIHRFSERLLGRKDTEISSTALRIIASMKQDWMQTRRNPSGLWGAALYIAALAHGHRYSKAQVVSVVHVCEATLNKQLVEIENAESGFLTIEEFVSRVGDVKGLPRSSQLPIPAVPDLESPLDRQLELVCEHKNSRRPHFAHRLCKECYNLLTEFWGGLEGSAELPAFRCAERQRIEYESMKMKFGKHERIEGAIKISESLSDIDDDDVDAYLNNEREKQYKMVIWEEMNREYLEEQAAKASAAERVEDGAKPIKERKQRRDRGYRNSTIAATTAEATKDLLKNKRLSSRINYDVLSTLYEDGKRQRTEPDAGVADGQNNGNKENSLVFDTETAKMYGDGNSAEVEYDEYFGEGDDGYPETGYNEKFGDGDEEYLGDDYEF